MWHHLIHSLHQVIVMSRVYKDSYGRKPEYNPGDRVYVHPTRMQATVIRQVLHYDYPESFWGNLELQYDDGIKGTAHSWQCSKVVE
jgi:hypothetical protein